MKVVKSEEGFVLIPVLGVFFIILLSILPFVQNQSMWKDDLVKMRDEAEIHYALESGIALSMDQIKQINNFQGNKSYVYNENTYVIQFKQDSKLPIVHCTIGIPALTYKKIFVDISKDDFTIQKWEEGFVYE